MAVLDTVTMGDMFKIFPSENFDRLIKEGILLPKVSGHITNALYPSENIPRLQLFVQLHLVGPGMKTPYNTLRLVLWLSGYEVSRIKKDLVTLVVKHQEFASQALSTMVAIENEMKTQPLRQMFRDSSDKGAGFTAFLDQIHAAGGDLDLETSEDFIESLSALMVPFDTKEDRTDSGKLAERHALPDAGRLVSQNPDAAPLYEDLPHATTFGDIDILGTFYLLLNPRRGAPAKVLDFLDALDARQLGVIGHAVYQTMALAIPEPLAVITSKDGKTQMEAAILGMFTIFTNFSQIFGRDLFMEALTLAADRPGDSGFSL